MYAVQDLQDAEISVRETKTGELRGHVAIAAAGVYKYTYGNTELNELLHPEELFHPDTIESSKFKPITDEHPDDKLITPKNAKSHWVGHIGENIIRVGNKLVAPIVIVDKATVDIVKNGKVDVSAAYTVEDTIMEKGTFEGMDYDAKQVGIRMNHLSIVKSGRMKDKTRINIKLNADESDLQEINEELNKISRQYMKEAEDSKIKDLQTQLDNMNNLNKQLIGEKLNLSEELRTVKSDPRLNSENVEKIVNDKVGIISQAKPILGDEDLTPLTIREIQEKVIRKNDSTVDFKDKSDDYITGLYHMAIKNVKLNSDLNDSGGSVASMTFAKRGEPDNMTNRQFINEIMERPYKERMKRKYSEGQ